MYIAYLLCLLKIFEWNGATVILYVIVSVVRILSSYLLLHVYLHCDCANSFNMCLLLLYCILANINNSVIIYCYVPLDCVVLRTLRLHHTYKEVIKVTLDDM